MSQVLADKAKLFALELKNEKNPTMKFVVGDLDHADHAEERQTMAEWCMRASASEVLGLYWRRRWPLEYSHEYRKVKTLLLGEFGSRELSSALARLVADNRGPIHSEGCTIQIRDGRAVVTIDPQSQVPIAPPRTRKVGGFQRCEA